MTTMASALMDKYTFLTDEESSAYCDEIIEHMTATYGVEKSKCIEVLNYQFQHSGWQEIYYHESPQQWAEFICENPESCGYQTLYNIRSRLH